METPEAPPVEKETEETQTTPPLSTPSTSQSKEAQGAVEARVQTLGATQTQTKAQKETCTDSVAASSSKKMLNSGLRPHNNMWYKQNNI